MVLPCQHFYCGSCYHSKKSYIGRCNNCGAEEKAHYDNKFLLDLMENLEFYKRPLNEKMRWMKTRIDRKFIV